MVNAVRGGRRIDSTSLMIALFSIMLIGATWAFVAMLVARDLAVEEARIVRENDFIARAFEEQTRRILKSAENGLLYMKEELEANRRVTPSLNLYCKLLKSDLSAVQVAVSDAKGMLIYSAVPMEKPISIAGRTHFIVQRDKKDVGTFVGQPVQLRLTGSYAFFLSKRLNNPDGSFNGIVSVGLDPAYFGHLFESPLVGDEHSGIVVGTDHIVRVRFNTVLKTVGDDISKISPVFTLAEKSSTGNYVMTPMADAPLRMASYRSMGDYPLIVIVSAMKDASLVAHLDRKSGYRLVGALFTAYILGFSYFLVRASRQRRKKNALLSEELAERRRAEEALGESRALFAGFMDHMPVLIWLLDGEGRFLYLNRASIAFFGRDLTGEEVSAIEDPMLARITGAEPEEGEYQRVTETLLTGARGVAAAFEVMRFGIVRGDKPQLTGYIARDLTARKVAEKKRLELERQLLEAQKLESLGLLAGGIAHDFNNLLLGVVANIDMALTATQEGEPAFPPLKRAEDAAQRAAELTNQMLAYSGRGRFVIERVDLSTLLSQMAPLLSSIHSKLVSIEYELATGLPLTEGDATQLRQVAMNLITNAADAYAGGEGVVRVRTGVERPGPVNADGEELILYFEVSDQGVGMDEATRAKIFEPFFTTKRTGRGLGLAAVEGIVRGHRGVIELTSAPGKGTTFRIFLPVAKGEARPTLAAAPGAAAVSGAGPTPGALVLLVDDEETVRTTATPILEMKGYKVLTAADGIDALKIFTERSDEISVVILDLTMPRMGGAEVFARMREINPSVPVLFSSGFSEEDFMSRFAKSGVAGFIQKPYRVRTLIDKVAEALRSSTLEKG